MIPKEIEKELSEKSYKSYEPDLHMKTKDVREIIENLTDQIKHLTVENKELEKLKEKFK